ncbi:hypothetical protein [uncultured Alistipes sp.]|uniref:hypothetical protein n=1 Tax=uncultured Alistipes sp. TaxID=538949 RepID=UPI00260D3A57|nr:hypothetical protein [uncultured Alistipes sp.]
MGKKVAFINIPTSAGWMPFLKNLKCNEPVHFHNIDNTAANGRQAIKRFLKKWPDYRFSTKTNKENHSFTIIRLE